MAARARAPVSGRRERFERIYDANYERILGYALRRSYAADDAADVVAETFLTAWRRLDDVPEGERARLWLYGTARKVLANQFRTLRRQRRLVDRLRTDLPCLVGDVTSLPEGPDVRAVGAAFARLTRSDRDLLIMVGWESLDAGEIATVVGCSRATARVRIHRARQRFEQALAEEGVQRIRAVGHEPGRWAIAHPDTEEAR